MKHATYNLFPPPACSYSGTGYLPVLAQPLCSYIVNQIKERIQGQKNPSEVGGFVFIFCFFFLNQKCSLMSAPNNCKNLCIRMANGKPVVTALREAKNATSATCHLCSFTLKRHYTCQLAFLSKTI